MSYGSRRHVVDPASIAKERRRSRAAPQTHVQKAHTEGSNQALSQALHGGAPLDARVRAEMEARFGEPLDDVRIHNDADAHVNAAALQAKAYTVGTDIVFSAERYAPHSAEGKRLLAHELAHVVQQRRGGSPPAQTRDAAHEASAVDAAMQVAAGASSVAVAGATGVGMAREPDDDELKKRAKPVDKSKKPLSGVDPDIDAMVEEGIVEAPTDQPAPKNPKPARRAATKQSKDARKKFAGKMREGYAQDLSVGQGGQVHHGVEVQALKRYPGVFTVDEINAAEGMRGIPAEQGGKRQLHNSKIREVWDRHYRNLDNLVKQRGLKPRTKAYNDFVRKYLFDARAEMDYLYGQFFSEQRAKAGLKSGGTESKTPKRGAKKNKVASPKKTPVPKKTAKKTAPQKKAAKAPQKKAAPKPKTPKKTAKKAATKAAPKKSAKPKAAPKKKAAAKKKPAPKAKAKKPVTEGAAKGKPAPEPTKKPATMDKPAVESKVTDPPAKTPEPPKVVEPAKTPTVEATPPVPEAPKAPPVEHGPTVEAPKGTGGKVAGGAFAIAGFLGAIPAAKDIKREWEEGSKAKAVAKTAELGGSFVPHLAPLYFAKGTIGNYWGPRHDAIQKDAFAVGEAVEGVIEDIPLIGDIPYLPKLAGALEAANVAVNESIAYTVMDMGEAIGEGAEDVYDWLTEPVISDEEMQRLLKQMRGD